MQCFTLLVLSFILFGCASNPQSRDMSTAKPTLKVHGHRGTRGTLPENSMVGFEEALKVGSDILEMDLHVSKDKVLIVSHDSAVSREICVMPNGKKVKKTIRLRTLTAQQIQKYDCGRIPHPRFPEQKQVPNTSMPTLDEVLTWFAKTAPSHVELNIETKMDEPKKADNPDPKFFASAVIDLLKKHGLLDRAILQSFEFSTLVEAKKIEPALRTAALFENEKNFCAVTEQTGATMASPDFTLVTAKEVAECRKRGIPIHPWTANTEKDWAKLVDLGVDGIITDYPAKLLKFLNRG